jgi:hypothetical protein
MSEASPPSMLPNVPWEPAYEAKLRGRLRTEIVTRRRTELEHLRCVPLGAEHWDYGDVFA